ncbi:MAG: HAD family phosphatase [Oligoflexia bacterium]|nr:HAD family phosphatase [Oligoflexia bacterium]
MIKLVAFDLGGVFFDWNPRYLFCKLFQDSEEMEFFLKEVCHHEWNLQTDRGVSFKVALQEAKTRFPKYSEEIDAYFDRWIEMIRGCDGEMVRLLEEVVSKGHRTAALSNWSAETFPFVFNRYAFFENFEEIIVSGFEKVVKPEPEIYKLLIDRSGLKPSEILFLDDVHKNVEGAQKLGIDAFVFLNPQQCRMEFVKRGLLD